MALLLSSRAEALDRRGMPLAAATVATIRDGVEARRRLGLARATPRGTA
jgi:hypothetical protein